MVTVEGVAPEQGLLKATGPVVDLFGDLPQHEGLREEEGPQAQTATS